MSPIGTLSLAKARRMLRRATRLTALGHPTEALPDATDAAQLLRAHAELEGARRPEYVIALLLLTELHLAVCDLNAALGALNLVIATLETDPCPQDGPDDAADRLADALTRHGDTYRLLADHRCAARDLDRALHLAVSPPHRVAANNALGILAKDTGR